MEGGGDAFKEIGFLGDGLTEIFGLILGCGFRAAGFVPGACLYSISSPEYSPVYYRSSYFLEELSSKDEEAPPFPQHAPIL